MTPRSISSSYIYTAAIYSFYFLFPLHFYFLLRLILCIQQDGGIDNPSDSLGAKLVVSYVQVQVKQVAGTDVC